MKCPLSVERWRGILVTRLVPCAVSRSHPMSLGHTFVPSIRAEVISSGVHHSLREANLRTHERAVDTGT